MVPSVFVGLFVGLFVYSFVTLSVCQTDFLPEKNLLTLSRSADTVGLSQSGKDKIIRSIELKNLRILCQFKSKVT